MLEELRGLSGFHRPVIPGFVEGIHVEFARLAVVNGRLDEEDEVHARFTVDRSRDCGPVEIEVVFDNYNLPQPWVKFDANGRYKGKSR